MIPAAHVPPPETHKRLGVWFIRALVVSIAPLAWVAAGLLRDIYAGIPPAIPFENVRVSCEAPGSASCSATVTPLNPGRVRVAVAGRPAQVSVDIGGRSAIERARAVLVRTSVAAQVRLGSDGRGIDAVAVASTPVNRRFVIAAPGGTAAWNRLTFTPSWPDEAAQEFEIAEFGLFDSDRGLLAPEAWHTFGLPPLAMYFRVLPLVMFALWACGVAAAWIMPAATIRRLAPPLCALLAALTATFEVGTTFSPYWSQDLRAYYASEWLPQGPDSNLTGALYEGSRIVQGLGQTVRPAFVQWHRMPGYGWLCAFAAAAWHTTDVIEIAAIVVLVQIAIYAVSVGAFVWAGARYLEPRVAALLGVAVALVPKQLAYTQPDSIVVPLLLLILAALLLYLGAEERKDAAFRHFAIVNVAFALWFVTRNDVLPGWFAVAAILAGRRWRYMLVPVALAALVALPWGAYKRQYRHEFDLLPTNAGEVMLLSLCEVPGRFPFECTDTGYIAWARSAGHFDPATAAASRHGVAEAIRYWITYPVHFAFMVSAKLRLAVLSQSWYGFRTRFNWPYELGRTIGSFVLLLTVLLTTFAVGHERRRTLLLGWAVVFNMPLFLVSFASAGRFYPAAGVSLLAAVVPALLERDLYARIARHRRRFAAVLVCVAAFVAGGRWIEQWIERRDSVHYWAPLLDPAASTLSVDRPRP